MSGLLNTQELREFQDFVKHLGTIAKQLQRQNELNVKHKSIEKDTIDAINNLSNVIKESTEKITKNIESVIAESKPSRD